jgi:hypothetical protein
VSVSAPVGPACAGAMVEAVSAAQISSAERKEAKTVTVKLRLTADVQAPITCKYFCWCLP